jgi:protein-tyrosine phosphatase
VAGVDVLISCLTPREVAEFGLERERELSTSVGLAFESLPIEDFSTPQCEAVEGLLDRLEPKLAAGDHIAVHCRHGRGRSPLLAATILAYTGQTADEAWELVAVGRGESVPETPEQREWPGRFVERRRRKA